MKTLLYSRDRSSKGAALMIVLAFVVLLTGLALAYFSRAGTDRQLSQSSFNDTSSDLLARSALDIVVGDFKQELLDPSNATVTRANIQPSPYPIPTPADIPNLIRYSSRNAAASRASNISSAPSPSATPKRGEITLARWNSHYLVPRLNTGITVDSTPVLSFTAPDWVLVTAQGPTPSPSPNQVIGRYAFAVYDEGGLLDMNVAGYPNWSGNPTGTCSPSPTPWLVNIGRKGIMAFADLTALGSYAPPQNQVDNIVGWRNYAMTQRTFTGFPSPSPSPIFGGETDCTKQNFYGSYLLYFGDPPFIIDSPADKLAASIYPFTSVANYVSNNRTDQALMTRQELLKLRSSIGFSQNVLQYMGTFSRERNRPAPDWPDLGGRLSEGRFNLNNLALVVPNPADCNIDHGKKVGWRTGKNRNHLCGDDKEVHKLFGLFWLQSDLPFLKNEQPGYWKYIGNAGLLPEPGGDPDPRKIDCLRGANQQNDFFQILNYALSQDPCGPDESLAKTFSIGASLIDQYDSGEACHGNNSNSFEPGCDLDKHVKQGSARNRTHTTVIVYGHSGGNTSTAYGMEPNISGPNSDPVNGDDPWQGDCSSNQSGNNPHRPCGAPVPGNRQVISHAFATVGEFGYGIDTSNVSLPTLDFSSPNFQDAPVLDFFGYNPISSAYPRAGIVNLYTRNAPVLAAVLSRALVKDPGPTPGPAPTPVISAADAMTAANAIVAETQRVLSGTAIWPVTHTDLTRAVAARLSAAAANAVPSLATSDETKKAVARAVAEMGQTRTWNLFIDVIAQTGRYAPGTANVTDGSKFTVEGEKRYWLHIALSRDLNTDGSVDVLGTQLEEVTE